MKIVIELKLQFKPRAYPGCETSRQLSFLIKRNTFSKEQLKILKNIGFEIEYKGYLEGLNYFEK